MKHLKQSCERELCAIRRAGFMLVAFVMLLGIFGFTPLIAEAKIPSIDGVYELDVPDIFWTGEEEAWVRVVDQEGGVAALSSLTQSKKLFKIRKDAFHDEKDNLCYDYYIEPVKPGKTTVTAAFKDDGGVQRQTSFNLTVKKYPNAVKSLKVNGKKIKIAAKIKQGKKIIDQRFRYSFKSTKQSARIKMSLKNGWKISRVKGIYSIGSGDHFRTRNIPVSSIKKGNKIDFAKKWDDLTVHITMKDKQGNKFVYAVSMGR